MSKWHHYIFLAFTILGISETFAQANLLPLNSFYKDKFVEVSAKKSVETFFPASELQLNLNYLIRDSSVQYYDFTDWFFKKNWVEIKKGDAYLKISPIVDFTYAKQKIDTSTSTLFRNTRGLYFEGGWMNKIGFSFAFAENQARFMDYETAYFNSRGELYPNGPNATYVIQNAVIPGGGRTKPFKTNAFDYAYSVGNISWQVNSKLRIDAGNNQHFIGSGYRSLLLSDNSFGATGARIHWKINQRWNYQVLLRNHKNLYRKPSTNQIEQPYESKFFAASYLTFRPVENFAISLFTAGNHLRGDSIVKHAFNPQMLIPVPLIQNDLLFGNSALFNGISGLNVDFALQNTRIYGQVAIDKFGKTYLIAGQIGAHFFKILKVKNLNAQVEMNVVPSNFYASQNPKLSYSHTNLPLAHPKGNNFAEWLVRLNYEYKRAFVSSKTIFYRDLKNSDSIPLISNSIFAVNDNSGNLKSSAWIQELEIGYRFNRKFNATISAGWKGRFFELGNSSTQQQMFFIGLKTGIFNQYLDF